jgi:hypothetical protein
VVLTAMYTTSADAKQTRIMMRYENNDKNSIFNSDLIIKKMINKLVSKVVILE